MRYRTAREGWHGNPNGGVRVTRGLWCRAALAEMIDYGKDTPL